MHTLNNWKSEINQKMLAMDIDSVMYMPISGFLIKRTAKNVWRDMGTGKMVDLFTIDI